MVVHLVFYFFNMWAKLGDKETVVQFQQFCGLRWKTSSKHESKDCHSDLEITDPDKYLQNGGLEKANTHSDFECNTAVHILFYLSSALGDEQVLIALLSFVLWNIDHQAVIRVYLSLAISLYLGQGAKDTFLAPRPPSPPVIRVEKKYAEEYSTPSTHAMIGVVVPFSLVYYTHEKCAVGLSDYKGFWQCDLDQHWCYHQIMNQFSECYTVFNVTLPLIPD